MAVAPDRAVLSHEELNERIRGLSPADHQRLVLMAKSLVGGLGLTEHDLLHDAFMAVFDDRRTCPVDTDITTFMYGVMRSLASSNRKSDGRIPELVEHNPDLDVVAATADQFISTSLARNPADLVEEDDAGQNLLKQIEEHFACDEAVQLIVMSECHGDDPAEIRAAVGKTELEYKAARKRLRRYFLAELRR